MDGAVLLLPAPAAATVRRHHAPRRILLVLPALALVAGFAFTRTPQPTLATPLVAGRLPLTQPVAVAFSWPVSRTVHVALTPAVDGQVSFGNSFSQGRLFRSLQFTPEVTWAPDTTYTLTLTNVDNALPGTQQAADFQLTFTTAPLPAVQQVSPAADATLTADTVWRVTLDRPVDDTAHFNFQTNPGLPVTVALTEDKQNFVVTPGQLLPQGQTVTLRVERVPQQLTFGTTEVASQGEAEVVASQAWPVRPAAGIASITPQGSNVPLSTDLVVAFTEAVTLEAVIAAAKLEPALAGHWETVDAKSVRFVHDPFAQRTTHTLTLAKSLRTVDGGFLPDNATSQFTSVGPVQLASSNPANNATGIRIRSALHVTFDQPVDTADAAKHLRLSPAVTGTVSWKGNTLTFTSAKALAFDTTYTATFAKGVIGLAGFPSADDLAVTFTTERATTRLAVPLHLQGHSLSCEIATLVMALRYRGVNIGEATIIKAIGVDPTPKRNGVWGDPDVAFVGDIDGQQPGTGYGVYAAPIAKAGSAYRKARAFENGKLADILAEVKAGNPVIVWGNASSGRRIDWKTAGGKSVWAISGEHTRVVIGFVGTASNPTTIITLDPLFGERRFSRAAFLADWALLGNMGVVVE